LKGVSAVGRTDGRPTVGVLKSRGSVHFPALPFSYPPRSSLRSLVSFPTFYRFLTFPGIPFPRQSSFEVWMIYRVTQKLVHFAFYALTSSNIDRFSNLFHFQNQANICNDTVTKDSTTPQLWRYTRKSYCFQLLLLIH